MQQGREMWSAVWMKRKSREHVQKLATRLQKLEVEREKLCTNLRGIEAQSRKLQQTQRERKEVPSGLRG